MPTSATVWTLALLDDSSKLTFGGEASTVSIFDIESREEWLQLPIRETAYRISFSHDSLTFTDGDRVTMFGKGGTHYSWQDLTY